MIAIHRFTPHPTGNTLTATTHAQLSSIPSTMASTQTPTTTQQRGQPPPPRPRLMIRGLHERQRRAQQASIEAKRLVARWDKKRTTAIIGTEQQLEEDDRAMAQAVEAMRNGVCNSGHAKVVRTPSKWKRHASHLV